MLSEERTSHLEKNEKWIMRVAVASSLLAIGSFTYTKWEVEARLKEELNEAERKAWLGGGHDAVMDLRAQNEAREEAARRLREEAVHAEAARRLPKSPPPLTKLDGFVASDLFCGAREGMVFKSDVAGVGYYVDEPLVERVKRA